MVWERLARKGTFERRPPSGPLHPPSLSWPQSPSPVSDSRSTLCFTTLLQAHWPSCCSSHLPSWSLPQNLSAFRSFCLESSSSRSSSGSRPHLIQVSAPVSAPQGGAPPSTISHSTGPAQLLPGAHHNMASLSLCPLVCLRHVSTTEPGTVSCLPLWDASPMQF